MRNPLVHLCLSTALALAALLAFPAFALADGGPILSDPQLWASLKEGQQTAVVRLNRNDTARVDLFVTMLDSTGTSHEVVYFVPLGKEAADFGVIEKSSLDFDREQTKALDETIRQSADAKNNTWLYLLGASAPISGAWLLPLYVPSFILVGCAAGPAPEATFKTESSSVSIYGLNEDTNLEELINTTGLDPSVQETLSRLRGQRIAVISLRTQAGSSVAGASGSSYPAGQPGIHLSWTSTMVRQANASTYSYPLGTGSAWSSPIELTRVYVVAPPGVDFSVRSPRLGEDRSGYNFAFVFGQDTPRILGSYSTRAYAIDQATGSFGRIWRATYSQSNSSEDLVIQTGSKGPLISTRQFLGGLNGAVSLLIGLLAAAALWVTAWRYIMPRMLGIRYQWGRGAVWQDALSCLGINAGILVVSAFGAIVVGIVGLNFLQFGGFFAFLPGLLVIVFAVVPSVFGVPAILLYVRKKWFYTDWQGSKVSWRRTVTAYVLVAVAANLAYLLFAFGYAGLVGAL